MSLLERLSDKKCWEKFYSYKTSLACPKQFTAELRRFIDSEGYLPVCERIRSGERFPLPKRSVISKQDTNKKRVIYTYPPAENTVLKLLTHLLLREYDGLFAGGLYSFRPGRTAQQAFKRLAYTPGVREMWSYKADISNYFNSVDIDRFLPELHGVLADDEALYSFLAALLKEPCVLERGREFRESKGIMAGTPLSSFFANLYLKDLDWIFAQKGVPYARYSDDILLLAKSEEEARQHAQTVRSFLESRGLTLNPEKERFAPPEEGWVFLGLSYREGVTDIAPASVIKMKQKMRRKTRALMRWQKRSGVSGEKAAKAFIRVFNRKLFENGRDNDLTWACWFFPVITTDRSLHELDLYAQDCLRYLITGRRTKSRFNARYDQLKALGYKSLVHEYYKTDS